MATNQSNLYRKLLSVRISISYIERLGSLYVLDSANKVIIYSRLLTIYKWLQIIVTTFQTPMNHDSNRQK